MYTPTASTTSLVPAFPGAFPSTPHWTKTGQRTLDPLEDIPCLPTASSMEVSEKYTDEVSVCAQTDPGGAVCTEESGTSHKRTMAHTPSTIFTTRATITLALPVDREEDDTSSDLDSSVLQDASHEDTASHFTTSSTGYASTASVASADVASTSRSNLSSFGGCPYSIQETHPTSGERFVYGFATRSSLSLSVDLVGLPNIQRPTSNTAPERDGCFFDHESLRYFGVDLSTLSQPDGRDWTLGLGVTPIPRDPSSSDDPSSHSTLSPLAGRGSVDSDSMTSLGTYHPLDVDYASECQQPNGWPHSRVHTMVDFVSNHCDQSHPPESVRVLDTLPHIHGSVFPLPSKEISRSRQILKGLVKDVKRLGRKMKTQFSKNQPKKSRIGELPFSRRSGMDNASLNQYHGQLSSNTSPMNQNFPFHHNPSRASGHRASMDASSTKQSLNSRPPTPSMGVTLTQVSSDVRNIRRRTLPPAWGDSFDPYRIPAEPTFERRPRPASLIVGSHFMGVRYEDFRALESIPGSPPVQYQEFHHPQQFSCNHDTRFHLAESVEPPERKSRWSTLSFLTRLSKR